MLTIEEKIHIYFSGPEGWVLPLEIKLRLSLECLSNMKIIFRLFVYVKLGKSVL